MRIQSTIFSIRSVSELNLVDCGAGALLGLLGQVSFQWKNPEFPPSESCFPVIGILISY